MDIFICDFTQRYSFSCLQHVKSKTVFLRELGEMRAKPTYLVRFDLSV